jgi:putative ATP-dependent endonuclease of the OLD family
VARIRKVEITNFRCIKSLTWYPSPGINCLIGSGDSGKSTVLDAIDLCLGARRIAQFNDADFNNLDVTSPINIVLTIGELDETLKNIDAYGLYLRGYNRQTGVVEDEPAIELEAVLNLSLAVGSDLDPIWILISDRAAAQGASRNLSWSDRVRLAPTLIGAMADYNLGWRRGSVLNRLTDEKADASAALVQAARHARVTFGDDAETQLAETLRIVKQAATSLGINVGDRVRALLDAHSVTFNGGAISLHNADGVPLHGLGVGSTRLLIAGLQREAASQSSVLLVDEVEHGLEPHRIIRFLGSLGAKESPEPMQVFMTTHSPVALCELNGRQLFILRREGELHEARWVGTDGALQSTLRLYPEAFLAASVIVCEGASEVGLLRGLDQHYAAQGFQSMSAAGVALVDCGGGNADRPFERATSFQRLGYRVAVLRDDDKKPTVGVEEAFLAQMGTVFRWRDDRALEDELFCSLSDDAIEKMLNLAAGLHGDALVNEHIKSASNNTLNLYQLQKDMVSECLLDEERETLGSAARTRRAGWFKSVTWMEIVAREIVAVDLNDHDQGFRQILDQVFAWAHE